PLGLISFSAGLPTILLTPFGGSAADRLDKRKILIATQIAQIAFALGLGWLVLTNRIQIWHVIIFAGLLGISIAFEMPAISALVPELVKRDEIAAAVALDRSVFHLSGHASSGCAKRAQAWASESGMVDGRKRHGRISRRGRVAHGGPRSPFEIHERQCPRGRSRRIFHVAFAQLLADRMCHGRIGDC